MRLSAGKRRTKIVIEERTGTQEQVLGTWSYSWNAKATVFAEVQEMLGSERAAEGLNMANRPCRIRMLFKEGITSAMRVRIGTRLLQIVRGPVELGNRDGLQMICEEYSSAGEAT